MKKRKYMTMALLAAGLVGFFLLLPRPAPLIQAADDTGTTRIVFKGVRLFDGERVHTSVDVLIEDETIAAVGGSTLPTVMAGSRPPTR